MKSNLDTVRYLVENAKADVNLPNHYKQTPLMLSLLAASDVAITNYLLHSPTPLDINAQDSVSLVYIFLHLKLHYYHFELDG